MTTYLAHVPAAYLPEAHTRLGAPDLDVLVEIWENGAMTVKVRTGPDQTNVQHISAMDDVTRIEWRYIDGEGQS